MFVFCGAHEIYGEVSDDGHVFGTVAFTETRLVIAEGDIEDPVEAVLDRPVTSNRLGGSRGGENGGRYVISCLESAAVLEFGAGGDFDDGGDVGQTEFAGETTITVKPIDLA